MGGRLPIYTEIMIARQLTSEISEHLDYFPIVAVIGPRQCGKTTLVRSIVENRKSDALYLDLEKPSHLAKLQDPEIFLAQNREKLICLDEIQRRPDLFPILRSLCDESGQPDNSSYSARHRPTCCGKARNRWRGVFHISS